MPLPSSFPHGDSFSLENFISLASCPFVCKIRLGLVPNTHQMLRTGKTPTQPAEEEGLGRPRAVALGSGDQHDWQKYPKVFFTGVTVQCSPTVDNEQQQRGRAWGKLFLHQSSPWGASLCFPEAWLSQRFLGECSWKWQMGYGEGVGTAGIQVTPYFSHFLLSSSPWKCSKNTWMWH